MLDSADLGKAGRGVTIGGKMVDEDRSGAAGGQHQVRDVAVHPVHILPDGQRTDLVQVGHGQGLLILLAGPGVDHVRNPAQCGDDGGRIVGLLPAIGPGGVDHPGQGQERRHNYQERQADHQDVPFAYSKSGPCMTYS